MIMNKLTELDRKALAEKATHKDFLTPGRYYRKLVGKTMVTDIDETSDKVMWQEWRNCYPPESAVVL
jgi:hypothetical protein